MANGYNPDLGLTSLSDLLGIINYVGGGNKQENYGSLFKLHAEHVQSYDNEEIDYSLQKSQEYLDKYRDKMSDVEIEQYDLLIDKYGHQKERNNNYASSYDLFATSYNDQLLELGEDYADAETATSWDYIESTTDPNGQTIQTQHKVNFPDWQALGYTGPNDKEFLKSAEYISFMNEVGGVDGYIAARNDYKVHVKNKLEDQIKSFIQTKEAFRSKYADRLRSDFADHNQNLEEMNFAYSFLLSSIEDGVLDSEERNAYEQSLMRSDIRPITDFEAKTGEVRKISREWTLKNMVDNVTNADIFYDHFQKFDNILRVDMGQVNPNDPYLTIPAEFLKDEKDPQIVNYQEAHDWASTQNPTEAMLLDPRYNYLANVGGLLQQTKAQIEQQDSNLIKNSGASFINTLHGRDWLDDVRAGDAAFVPGQPGTLVDDDDDDVIDTVLPVVDDNKIDTSTLVSNIPKTSKFVAPKVKKWSQDINDIQSNIDNYTTSNYSGVPIYSDIDGSMISIESTGTTLRPLKTNALYNMLGRDENEKVEHIDQKGVKRMVKKPITHEELLVLKKEFISDAKEYEFAIAEIERLQNLGIEYHTPKVWLGTDEELNPLEQDLRKYIRIRHDFKKKWKTNSSSLIDEDSWKIYEDRILASKIPPSKNKYRAKNIHKRGANVAISPAEQLRQALLRYRELELEHKVETNNLEDYTKSYLIAK